MNGSINLALLVTFCCFVTSVCIMNWSLEVPTSHASSFLPEKNSTHSNSSASGFESNPITTIIIPNKGSNLTANSSNIYVSNLTNQSAFEPNSLTSNDTSSGLVENHSNLVSSNDTLKTDGISVVPKNDTLSDSQQKGKYLIDDNGIHYYNVNNCSEKKGSSGIGDMSECEDAAKEMSEE